MSVLKRFRVCTHVLFRPALLWKLVAAVHQVKVAPEQTHITKSCNQGAIIVILLLLLMAATRLSLVSVLESLGTIRVPTRAFTGQNQISSSHGDTVDTENTSDTWIFRRHGIPHAHWHSGLPSRKHCSGVHNLWTKSWQLGGFFECQHSHLGWFTMRSRHK